MSDYNDGWKGTRTGKPWTGERRRGWDDRQTHINKIAGGPFGGGGGAATCFPAGTIIRTPTGTSDISLLCEGDFVLAVNVRTGKLSAQKILRVVTPHPSTILRVQFADGSCVRTTKRHSFRINGQWMKACNIEIGDIVAAISENMLVEKTVTAISPGEAIEPVYNLIVAEDFTFIADDFIVHSFTYFRKLMVAIWSRTARHRSNVWPVAVQP